MTVDFGKINDLAKEGSPEAVSNWLSTAWNEPCAKKYDINRWLSVYEKVHHKAFRLPGLNYEKTNLKWAYIAIQIKEFLSDNYCKKVDDFYSGIIAIRSSAIIEYGLIHGHPVCDLDDIYNVFCSKVNIEAQYVNKRMHECMTKIKRGEQLPEIVSEVRMFRNIKKNIKSFELLSSHGYHDKRFEPWLSVGSSIGS